MRSLTDGESPQQLGIEADASASSYEDLVDRISGAADGQLLGEYADDEYGTLVTLEPGEREKYQVTGNRTAAVCWTQSRQREPQTEVRLLTDQEAQRLLENFQSVIVERVIRHYEANPANDGHPAYQLHTLHQRTVEQHRAATTNSRR